MHVAVLVSVQSCFEFSINCSAFFPANHLLKVHGWFVGKKLTNKCMESSKHGCIHSSTAKFLNIFFSVIYHLPSQAGA